MIKPDKITENLKIPETFPKKPKFPRKIKNNFSGGILAITTLGHA